jgi:thioredoxin 1
VAWGLLGLFRCPPCRRIAPVLDALARQHADDVLFVKVDVDRLPSVKAALGVYAMPSFYFFRHGNRVGSFLGANEALLRKGIANGGNVGMCSSLPCTIQ